MFELNGKSVIVDPYISPNPLASGIDLSLIKVDYILLTHGHGDHVADAGYLAKINNATIVASYEVAEWYNKKDVTTYSMNIGGTKSFDFGTLKYVHAIHSSMLPDGSYGGPAGGFVIWNEEICFYISGDTALHMDMTLLPRIVPKLDFAILSIGDNFTMGVNDALIASDFISCDEIVGCHFDTFPAIQIDHAKAVATFKESNKNLTIPNIGQTLKFERKNG